MLDKGSMFGITFLSIVNKPRGKMIGYLPMAKVKRRLDKKIASFFVFLMFYRKNAKSVCVRSIQKSQPNKKIDYPNKGKQQQQRRLH
jgi:hypothetical protein